MDGTSQIEISKKGTLSQGPVKFTRLVQNLVGMVGKPPRRLPAMSRSRLAGELPRTDPPTSSYFEPGVCAIAARRLHASEQC